MPFEVRVTRSLSALLALLDAWNEAIPLDVLDTELRRTVLVKVDYQRMVSFGDKAYRRNLLHDGPAYHALVLCWRAGQRSPIHDHSGSSCAVRVLEGIATETASEDEALLADLCAGRDLCRSDRAFRRRCRYLSEVGPAADLAAV